MTWHYRGHFWTAITHDGGVNIEELMYLYLKPQQSLANSLRARISGTQGSVWNVGALDVRQLLDGAGGLPPGDGMIQSCAWSPWTADSPFLISKMFWGHSLGTISKTGKLSDSPRGREGGWRQRLRAADPYTCQLVCHRQATITDWSIIWLKRAFHLRLFFFNPDWNLNLLESYQNFFFLTWA